MKIKMGANTRQRNGNKKRYLKYKRHELPQEHRKAIYIRHFREALVEERLRRHVPDRQLAGPVHAPEALAIGQVPTNMLSGGDTPWCCLPGQAKVANAHVVVFRYEDVTDSEIPMHDAQLQRNVRALRSDG